MAFRLLGKTFNQIHLKQHFFYDHLLQQNYPETLFGPIAKIVGKDYKVIKPDVTDYVRGAKEQERLKAVSDSISKAGGH